MTNNQYTIEKPVIEDAAKMWELADKTSLDTNSSYSYLMMVKFFNDCCFVIKKNNTLIGFVTGFLMKNNTYFVWQICIDPEYRGKRLSFMLLNTAVKHLVKRDKIEFVRATAASDNNRSIRTFKTLAVTYDTFFATKDGFLDDNNEEMLIQVGPLNLDLLPSD